MKRRFSREGSFFTYILECNDGTFYTGYTPDITKRVQLHNAGKGAKYTRDRRPLRLVWCKEYRYFKKAFLEEKRIKKLTRAQKEKLVDGGINKTTMESAPNSKRRENLANGCAELKAAEKSLAKGARDFSGLSSACQPKVFIRTFGWPMADL